jgi:hypothetical protein
MQVRNNDFIMRIENELVFATKEFVIPHIPNIPFIFHYKAHKNAHH